VRPLPLAAQADSFVSSAAGAGSASSGSVSDSKRLVRQQQRGGQRRAEGRYRVTDVAQADAGRLRLTLARDGAEPLALTLPATAAAGLAVGSECRPRRGPMAPSSPTPAPVRPSSWCWKTNGSAA
jgi:hypothetical protein